MNLKNELTWVEELLLMFDNPFQKPIPKEIEKKIQKSLKWKAKIWGVAKTGAYIQPPGFKNVVPVYLIYCRGRDGREYFVIDYPHNFEDSEYLMCPNE